MAAAESASTFTPASEADKTAEDAAPAAYGPTSRTVTSRDRDHAAYDRDLVHSLLDQSYVCHLGFVRDGAPIVLPTLYARVGERLYVHGSTGSRPLRMAGANGSATGGDGATEDDARPAGLPVCLTVTHVDGVVLARSAFHHAINYRSVVVHGVAHQVTDPDERTEALDALVDHVVPGRAADCRPGNTKELAATAVLRLDLTEASAKWRVGGPNDEPEDLELPYWAGVLPVAPQYGAPIPSDDLDPAIPLPDYLAGR
ncbi:pyridoxamine 5'-phosphate oxidase family protein [Streptomyces sp. NPDC057702]|uniref:pyridoxamine 5'-phosphate oxidase family protein n=1 Tax=unclassified Streptomyces TaxID=2593676 RepID=UPI00367B42A0